MTQAQRWVLALGAGMEVSLPSGGGLFGLRGAEQKRHRMERDLPCPGADGHLATSTRGQWEGPEWTDFQVHVRPSGAPERPGPSRGGR